MKYFVNVTVSLVAALIVLLSSSDALAQRTASVSGLWSSTTTWGGQPVPTASDAVTISGSVTGGIVVTVDIAAECASLTVATGIRASTLALSGTNSLLVSGGITINSGSMSGANKFIDVGSGSLTCASVTMATFVGAGRTSEIKIGTGTVTISGNLTMNGSATVNKVTFTNSGILNIGGNIGGIQGGDIVPSTGTVNFNGSALQTVAMNANYVYYNLNLNNPVTAKLGSFVNATRVLGTINVESGIFSNGGFAIAGNAGKNFTVADGATLQLEGSSTFPTVFTADLGATSIVEYNGSSNQTVAAVPSPGYGYLNLSNSGIKTAAGGLDIRGDLFLNSETNPLSVTFATDSYTHNLAGHWINIETVVTGNSTINFNGSADQYIDGSLYEQQFYNINVAPGSSLLPYCGILTINNSLTVDNTGKVTISPNIQVTSLGTITNNSGVTGLIIQSDVSGTGSLIHPNSDVEATVQRYIDAADWGTWYAGWHFLSSPVAAQPINGTWTPSGIDDDFDFYAWDEPSKTWINFKNTTTPPTFNTVNPGTDFVVGRGYNIAYQQTATREFAGSLNVDDVTKTGLTVTAPAYYTWHLLGNPYSSALTWLTGWTLNDVGAVCQIWSDALVDYTPMTEGGIIPSMNGFMVEATVDGASLTIPASARVHDYTPWYKSVQSANSIKLTAWSDDRLTGKESIITLNPNSTVGFDAQFDGHYLEGKGPRFYSLAGDDQLSVNSLPELGGNVVIPLAFAKNSSSNFTVEMDTKSMIPDLTVYLTDTKTGVETNLSQDLVYEFTSADGDDIKRFELHFLSTTAIAPGKIAGKMQAYVAGNNLFINQSEAQSGKVNLFSSAGQLIGTYTLENSRSQSISLPRMSPGIYLVNVNTKNGTHNQKVVIR